MGSPPQGYISNAMASGGFQIKLDSSSRLGIFNDVGQEVLFIPLSATFRGLQVTDGSFVVLGETSNTQLNPKVVVQYEGILTQGDGLPAIYGLDNRSGLVVADGAPITLFAVPAGAGQLFRITADIFATVVSAGTANYTVTWTENAQSKTMVVSASVVNTLATATDLINPDASTNITAQLTFAGFTGTVTVASVVELLT